MYKRDPRSRYTYSFKCEARTLVNALTTNEQFKSSLVRGIKVIEILSDPLECCSGFEMSDHKDIYQQMCTADHSTKQASGFSYHFRKLEEESAIMTEKAPLENKLKAVQVK